jgi:hypothetical protein
VLWIEINAIIYDNLSFAIFLWYHKAARVILFQMLWLLRDIHWMVIAATTLSGILKSCIFSVLAHKIVLRRPLFFVVLLVTHFKLYSILFFRLCQFLLLFVSIFNWRLNVSKFWWVINIFLFFSRNRKIVFFLLLNRVAPSSWYQYFVFLLLHISFISNSY